MLGVTRRSVFNGEYVVQAIHQDGCIARTRAIGCVEIIAKFAQEKEVHGVGKHLFPAKLQEYLPLAKHLYAKALLCASTMVSLAGHLGETFIDENTLVLPVIDCLLPVRRTAGEQHLRYLP